MNRKFHDFWVLDFISTFKSDFETPQNAVDFFSFGYCYHFAVILSNIFDGTIMYNQIENHFASKILVETSMFAGSSKLEFYLYDINGKIPITDEWVEWSKFCEEEPMESENIRMQCIYKV